MKTTNLQAVNTTAKQAKQEVKNVSIMYYVNQLNKLARKNEYCDAVNVREFGEKVREYTFSQGIELKQGEFFTAYLFEKIDGVSYYKKTTYRRKSARFAVDTTIICSFAVRLSLTGVIDAYKAILQPQARKQDAQARAQAKSARKAQAQEKSARAKEIRKAQAQARIDYAQGKICMAEFAEIMAKVA